ncbi:alkaline phosphatase family protein [Parafilimonas terrae]|uniref:Type I phosphodiesterase / nucleotide pyrophosphatase n=1 Tax=Parafilimonas terrae TaxID=1465490 RepID=A0A1I5R9N6_9BACT|nr:alkaline phosphatase family protein [Parafilimonas terrae]SFP55110.1 Type I phosphodiesterase / nucleotide pyrophosphatase [Parafilimonas terrae]
MKYLITFCLSLFATGMLCAQPKTKKAVYIIIDGIPADVIEKLNPVHMNEIAKAGGYAHAMVGGEKNGYSQTPTISAVGYNSILTGTWVNKHNVWDNDIKDPNYNYKSIFRILKEDYPEKKTGIFSSWTDNRTRLVGDGLAATGNIHFDYKFDGLELDTVNYPQDAEREFMHKIDAKVAATAASTIKTNAPDLSWVYLEYTDDMGHKYGDSPQFYKAINYADDYVGQIWQAIQYREKNFNEDWLIIITTDHGRTAETGKDHGGQSDRERAGWIFTNAKNLNGYFKNNQASIVDIFPTIARFMNLQIPLETARELDGVPLIGELSLTNAAAQYKDDTITVEWKASVKEGSVKIWASSTNNYKEGGEDKFELLKTVPLADEKAILNVKNMPSSFYKLFLQGPGNNLSCWIVLNNKTAGKTN